MFIQHGVGSLHNEVDAITTRYTMGIAECVDPFQHLFILALVAVIERREGAHDARLHGRIHHRFV